MIPIVHFMKIWAMVFSLIKRNPSGISIARQHNLWDGHLHFWIMIMMGMMDIYKTNGALKHLYGQEDQLFENEGDGKFKDVSLELGKYFQTGTMLDAVPVLVIMIMTVILMYLL